MQEVEAICDRVIIINKGNIVADAKLNDLKDTSKQIIEVEFDLRVEQQFLSDLPNLISCENTFDFIWELTFDTQKDMRPAIFDLAHDNGLKILQLNHKNKNLETIFRELTKSEIV
jgi:protein involved in gliding motility GldA